MSEQGGEETLVVTSPKRPVGRAFYPVDAKLNVFQIFVFGLQHVLSMFVGIITPPWLSRAPSA